jgi:hypothetical protein
MNVKFLLKFISLSLMLSCTNKNTTSKKENEVEPKTEKENITGGACSYRHTISKAIISSIEIDDQKNAVIKYKTLSSLNNDYEMQAYFKNYDLADKTKYPGKEFSILKVNDTVTFESQNIVSGSCSPSFSTLKISKFPFKKDTSYIQ